MNNTDRRKPLSFIVAANQQRRDGSVKLVVPFSADLEPGGMPVRITEVRTQTATWVSLLDERKTGTINLSNILVDPSEIEWRAPRVFMGSNGDEEARQGPILIEALPTPPPTSVVEIPHAMLQSVSAQASDDRGPEPTEHHLWRKERNELAIKGKRRCAKCRKVKDLDDFPKNGGSCSVCKSAYNKRYNAAHLTTAKPEKETMQASWRQEVKELRAQGKKRCAGCFKVKELADFGATGYCWDCQREKSAASKKKASATVDQAAAGTLNGVVDVVVLVPSTAAPDLITSLRKLRSERDELRAERDLLLAEKAELHAALQEVLG